VWLRVLSLQRQSPLEVLPLVLDFLEFRASGEIIPEFVRFEEEMLILFIFFIVLAVGKN
jgi:hypothetical protein